MSLVKAKKVEDLKAQANVIYSSIIAITDKQRQDAINKFIREAKKYLSDQGFNVVDSIVEQRSFEARYKDIRIKVSTSRDDVRMAAADYIVNIEKDSLKRQVALNLYRGKRIQSPAVIGDLDKLIDDYENRYIPELKSYDLNQLDGSFKILVYNELSKPPKWEEVSDAKAVIDMMF